LQPILTALILLPIIPITLHFIHPLIFQSISAGTSVSAVFEKTCATTQKSSHVFFDFE